VWPLVALGAIALLAVGGILAAVLAGGGDGGGEAPQEQERAFTQPVAPPDGPLAFGITEANPHLVAPGPQPEAFTAWRDRLTALEPGFLRVLVDWRRVQPSPSQGPDWSQPADGCLRGEPPCAAFSGIADQLRAAKAAGLQPVITILNTPEWAASKPSGCEGDAGPQARMPADLEAYGVLIRSLLELGIAEDVALPWWSAWNEPNHPTFFGPQRRRCDAASPALAPERYAELVRALKAELDAKPGEQRILLGEVAGYSKPKPNAAGAAEFAAALPRDVVCVGAAWAQHAYVKVEGELAADPVRPELLRGVTAALDEHDCEGGPLPVWITPWPAGPRSRRARPNRAAPRVPRRHTRDLGVAVRPVGRDQLARRRHAAASRAVERELRDAWASGRRVQITTQPPERARARGTVKHVAPTGAFAIVGRTHVPIHRIALIRDAAPLPAARRRRGDCTRRRQPAAGRTTTPARSPQIASRCWSAALVRRRA